MGGHLTGYGAQTGHANVAGIQGNAGVQIPGGASDSSATTRGDSPARLSYSPAPRSYTDLASHPHSNMATRNLRNSGMPRYANPSMALQPSAYFPNGGTTAQAPTSYPNGGMTLQPNPNGQVQNPQTAAYQNSTVNGGTMGDISIDWAAIHAAALQNAAPDQNLAVDPSLAANQQVDDDMEFHMDAFLDSIDQQGQSLANGQSLPSNGESHVDNHVPAGGQLPPSTQAPVDHQSPAGPQASADSQFLYSPQSGEHTDSGYEQEVPNTIRGLRTGADPYFGGAGYEA